MSGATAPPAMWAQRKDVILLTLNVESKDPLIEFTDNTLHFKGTGLPENKEYEVTINFFGNIKPEETIRKNIARCIELTIPKVDCSSYWPALTSDKKKYHWLKVDFNKWRDEGSDDEMELSDAKFGDNNMDDLIKNVDKLCNNSDQKPSFADLEEDEDEDSDDVDDALPYLV